MKRIIINEGQYKRFFGLKALNEDFSPDKRIATLQRCQRLLKGVNNDLIISDIVDRINEAIEIYSDSIENEEF